jgi:hypothetical protein
MNDIAKRQADAYNKTSAGMKKLNADAKSKNAATTLFAKAPANPKTGAAFTIQELSDLGDAKFALLAANCDLRGYLQALCEATGIELPASLASKLTGRDRLVAALEKQNPSEI